jgi:hypothetical protein
MKRASLLVVPLVALALASPARAKVTGIVATPTSPTLGTTFLIRTVDDGQAPSPHGVTFTYQLTIPGFPPTAWKACGGGVTARVPGYYTVAVDVVYVDPTKPSGVTTDVFSQTVPVGPATASRIVSGLGGINYYGQMDEVGLLCLTSAGGAPVGPYTDGVVQSCISQGTWLGGEVPATGWGDGWGSAIQFSPANIYSAWSLNITSAQYQSLAVGTPILTATQVLRLCAPFWDAANIQYMVIQPLDSHNYVVTRWNTVGWWISGS